MAITDRIELSVKSKSLKILNICRAIYLVAWLFMVLSAETFTIDYIKTLTMGAIFWSLLGKLWSKDAGLLETNPVLQKALLLSSSFLIKRYVLVVSRNL
jgi:hypothetical protein